RSVRRMIDVALGAIEAGAARACFAARRMTLDANFQPRHQDILMVQSRPRDVGRPRWVEIILLVADAASDGAMRRMVELRMGEPPAGDLRRCDGCPGRHADQLMTLLATPTQIRVGPRDLLANQGFRRRAF